VIVADVLTWFLIVAGTYLVLVCYWLCAYALFPRAVALCAERYSRPVVATLVGLLVLVPLLVLGVGAARALPGPPLGLLVRGLFLLPGLVALLGSAGLALRVGRGLRSPLDAAQPWRAALRGGLVLAPTFLLPFLGWFIVFPWTLVSGCGVALLALLGRGGAARVAPRPDPEP
jgi:hypothetical protein